MVTGARAKMTIGYQMGYRMRLYTGVYIAAAMGLFAVLFVPQGAASVAVGSTPAFMGAWTGLYVITIGLFVLQNGRVSYTDLIYFAVGLYAIFSALWSTNPMKTALYGGAFTMNALFVSQLLRHSNIDEIVTLIMRTIILLCAIGLVLSMVKVDVALYLDPHDRETIIGTHPVRGLFNHKITAGLYSAYGFVIAATTLKGVGRFGACALLTVFNLMTGSATGHLALVAGIGIFYITRFALSRHFSPTVFSGFLLVLSAIAGSLAWVVLPEVLSFLGRDPTLTGRTVLWSWGIGAGLERPLHGWGFVGYMGSQEAISYSASMGRFLSYEVPHFHNSYVQAFVELGAIGFAGYIALLFWSLRNAYSFALKYSSRGAAAVSMLVPLVAFSGMFINLFLKYNDFTTMFLLFTVMACRPVRLHSHSYENLRSHVTQNDLPIGGAVPTMYAPQGQ